MKTMTIARRFRGPPDSGNGGYVCGMLARHISGAAEVTLRRPPPLERPLEAIGGKDETWELKDGDAVVATGHPTNLHPVRIERASFAEAVAAEQRTPVKPSEHPLPTCFVCGPQRLHGDGLRLFAGPLERPPNEYGQAFATTWMPYPDLAAPDGRVAPEFVWSTLDCPTGYTVGYDHTLGRSDGVPILLGRLAARIDTCPRPGERCVITAWPSGRDGRKRNAEAAMFGETGELLAIARATWIVVDRAVQVGGAQPGPPP